MAATGNDTIILVSAADIDRVTDALLATGNYVESDAERPILRAAVQELIEKIIDDAIEDPRWLAKNFGNRLDDCLDRATRRAAQ